ncbi:MAG: DUF1592 domain-containing protein [Bradymonadia bacterium]
MHRPRNRLPAFVFLGGLVLLGCGQSADDAASRSYDDEGAGGSPVDDTPDAAIGGAPGTPEEACADPDPGRVTLRRLNRDEYDLTLRDLLGDRSAPARDFPADDLGHGFDNQADVLSVSPVLVEKYDRAAERVVEAALRVPRRTTDRTTVEAEALTSSVGRAFQGFWNLWSNGEVGGPVTFAEAGRYRLTIRAGCQLAGPDPCQMSVRFDGVDVAVLEVPATPDAPADYSVEVDATEGHHSFGAAFLNDFYAPDAADPNQRDRNLLVDRFETEGPLDFDPEATNPTRDAILVCAPSSPVGPEADACAREILTAFGSRAWRRALTPGELDRLVALVSVATGEGDPFERGVRLAMHALLLSPHFLFKVETDPTPFEADALTPHPLSGDELATRLSYFLWGSIPDEALTRDAASGALNDDAVLAATVDRMLDDPRAAAFVERFAGQWLHLRNLANVAPDYARFPDFDDALRHSMRAETEAYFRAFLDEDRSALDLLDARFTFLDARLARHYGLPFEAGDAPDTLRRVDLEALDPEGTRGGLLTHGSILTVTSFPTRTSPVKRGKWVMEQLLCSEPPPPPPGVEGLRDEIDANATFRERLEQHRAEPVCAGCHALMDPIGFGLETYDGIGAYRTEDAGKPIDDSGELPGERPFHGARELAALLKDDAALHECMVEQLFTFAVGRAPDLADLCALDEVEARFAADGHRFRALIKHLVQSPSFRSRRPENPGDAPPETDAASAEVSP